MARAQEARRRFSVQQALMKRAARRSLVSLLVTSISSKQLAGEAPLRGWITPLLPGAVRFPPPHSPRVFSSSSLDTLVKSRSEIVYPFVAPEQIDLV